MRAISRSVWVVCLAVLFDTFLEWQRGQTSFKEPVYSGGIIVANGDTLNSLTVRSHQQSTDEYFLFRRTIDSFVVHNSGNGVIKGIYMPRQEMVYFSYYDKLGTIHKKSRHGNLDVFMFRYPLKPGENISFTVETVAANRIFRTREGQKTAEGFFRKMGACSFLDELVDGIAEVNSEITQTYFYFWGIK